ncbi:hypothetical protein [Catenulispora sp. GAS73]|uniref:hypothetical protein n=1 Tax=Catenulispora sp. GAS73 TaxID=3156269 RepID=UPI0035126D43
MAGRPAPASEHDEYSRDIDPAPSDHPSPSHDGWLFVETVLPSTAPESYEAVTDGSRPPGTGGTRIGYEYVKSPLDEPACHEPSGDNVEAA